MIQTKKKFKLKHAPNRNHKKPNTSPCESLWFLTPLAMPLFRLFLRGVIKEKMMKRREEKKTLRQVANFEWVFLLSALKYRFQVFFLFYAAAATWYCWFVCKVFTHQLPPYFLFQLFHCSMLNYVTFLGSIPMMRFNWIRSLCNSKLNRERERKPAIEKCVNLMSEKWIWCIKRIMCDCLVARVCTVWS